MKACSTDRRPLLPAPKFVLPGVPRVCDSPLPLGHPRGVPPGPTWTLPPLSGLPLYPVPINSHCLPIVDRMVRSIMGPLPRHPQWRIVPLASSILRGQPAESHDGATEPFVPRAGPADHPARHQGSPRPAEQRFPIRRVGAISVTSRMVEHSDGLGQGRCQPRACVPPHAPPVRGDFPWPGKLPPGSFP